MMQSVELIGIGAFNEDYHIVNPKIVQMLKNQFFPRELEKRRELFVQESEIDGRLSQRDFPAQLLPIAGGSAFNTIRTVSSLGLEINTGFVGVAGLNGARLNIDAQTSGVDCTFFVCSEKHKPGRCLVLGSGHDSKMLTAPGATVAFSKLINNREKEIALIGGAVSSLVEYLAQARWIHLTSFAIPKSLTRSPLPFVLDAIEKAKEAKPDLILSFDPGDEYTQMPSKDVIKLMELSNYIFLNMREFRNLSQHDNANCTPIAELARGLYARGRFSAQAIVLKGASSDYWIHKVQERVFVRRHWHRWIPSVFVGDDIGAGDVFAGGFIAGNLRPVFDQYGRGPTTIATALVRSKLRRKAEIPVYDFAKIVKRCADRSLARERFNFRDLLRLYIPPLVKYIIAISAGVIGTLIVQMVIR